MVAATVTLTVTAGTHAGKRFVFHRPEQCVVGRANDCSVQLVGAFEDALVSRHHCEFNIDPPCIRVRDLGSRNGTFVNGHRIGQPKYPAAPEIELHDGDELCLGPIPFKVLIDPPPG
jgi:pSer/pThr/pTyr-binding forkhead associated (FHA) protein